MIRLVHELPKRLRFSVPQLRGDRRGAVAFRARFRVLGGVTAVETNPLTGSLIVHHDGQPETRERILRNLEEFARVAMPQRTASLPVTEPMPTCLEDRIDRVAGMIADAVAERVARRLIRTVVAALI